MPNHKDRPGNKYWQPLPIWDQNQWYGFSYTQVPTEDGPFWEVGIVFGDREYGRKAFEAIGGWNDNQGQDRQNNICISFIVRDDESEYIPFLYPQPSMAGGKGFMEIAILAKPFPNPPTSHFRKFQSSYKGDPFLLGAFYLNNDTPDLIRGITPVWKFHVKIKKRSQLTPQEFEYQHLDLIGK